MNLNDWGGPKWVIFIYINPFWATNGFWLYYRRLEKSTFKWPSPNSHGVIVISKPQLHWLLSGLSLENSKAHRPLNGLEV
ncbi:hypothetical protein D1115_17000 [Vibrio alfacsensis]|uniref:Transposase n=1 Tax=Vibrio alfacsensis TaxID=1074311 RepID=A0ABN5PKE1_9VIBR|nr:hypothetical protein D1115_17000 [Vibrio alfacsensis]